MGQAKPENQDFPGNKHQCRDVPNLGRDDHFFTAEGYTIIIQRGNNYSSTIGFFEDAYTVEDCVMSGVATI